MFVKWHVHANSSAATTLFYQSRRSKLRTKLYLTGSHSRGATQATQTRRTSCLAKPQAYLETGAGEEVMIEKSSSDFAQQVPVVITVAGSDSGGGAGIQADLKTFAACGVFGASAVTALTAQNTQGVSGIHEVPADFIAKQLTAVLDDLPVTVVKTGMLPSVEAVQELATALGQRSQLQVVVDPVLIATSGDSLASSDVGRAIADQLFPLATVVTPNLAEAAALLGGGTVEDVEGMKEAARKLHAMGPKSVLVKGGHLVDHGSRQQGKSELADVFYDGREMLVLRGPRIETRNTHGTGCTTASAVAAFLARGMDAPSAVRAARGYVTQALARSSHLQIGKGKQRPFNHQFMIDDWSSTGKLDLRLYGVTDPGCNQRCNRTSPEAVQGAIQGGATIIQLREKDCDGGAFCREAEEVLQVARPHGVMVLINDRIDVALAVGADGVHVGQDDIPAAAARQILGPGKILGVSVKTVEQARQAQADGADYLGAGAMHSTATKESTTISLQTLADICLSITIPVVAIGGLNAGNVRECMEAGCAGVAVVSAIFGADSPEGAARELRGVVDQCRQS